MTNYGPWKIWNGGECPVEDGVKGQVLWSDETMKFAETKPPIDLNIADWDHKSDPVVAYRKVIEPEAVVWDGLWDSGRKAIIGSDMCAAGLSRGVRITIQGDSIKAEWVE